MTEREEAEKVYVNLKGDHRQVAHYLVERFGDFVYDHQREDFIAEFLLAGSKAELDVALNDVAGMRFVLKAIMDALGLQGAYEIKAVVEHIQKLRAARPPASQELEHIAGYCDRVGFDGIMPSLAWFSETALALRKVIGTP